MKKFSNELEKLILMTVDCKGDSDGHLLTLFSIALSSKSKTILELGVRNGDTTLPLLLAAGINNATVHSVDINPTEYIPPSYLSQHWKFYKSDALKFLREWDRSAQIDLVYIDDWHSYQHVKMELEILDSIVTPNTIILLHDLLYGNTGPVYHVDMTQKDGQWAEGGPYRAVAELPQQFWEFSTLPWNNGLTILRKKYSSKYK